MCTRLACRHFQARIEVWFSTCEFASKAVDGIVSALADAGVRNNTYLRLFVYLLTI